MFSGKTVASIIRPLVFSPLNGQFVPLCWEGGPKGLLPKEALLRFCHVSSSLQSERNVARTKFSQNRLTAAFLQQPLKACPRENGGPPSKTQYLIAGLSTRAACPTHGRFQQTYEKTSSPCSIKELSMCREYAHILNIIGIESVFRMPKRAERKGVPDESKYRKRHIGKIRLESSSPSCLRG